MKNSIISISIFLLLVSFLFYADNKFKNLCTDIIEICTEMEDKLTTGNQQDNAKEAMDLFNMIDEKGHIAAIYINHIDYDQMLNESLRLSIYIEQYNSSEAASSLHLLKYNSQHMRDLQLPKLENIF